ncbi:S8 family serine peptidase [Gallaecimonas sp. GXIMD4217]|uniref:S8 family peptidase n=1 Tax=Gallaecimonas sp. GXIMD4217 TaxID=3131927 RepID=UPI00311B1034
MFKQSLLAATLAGLLAAPAAANEFLVVAKQQRLSPALERAIQEAGGTITNRIDAIGIALVEAPAHFKQDIAGAVQLQAVLPNVRAGTGPVKSQSMDEPPFSGDDDFFFDLQWGHTAVGAVGAWHAGYSGQGVRVAVLDSGIDSSHPDLAPNLNTALSASFVPGESYDWAPDVFHHGSHVAGTIAAADNGFGTIGVAPNAELVALKVLSAETGSGSSFGVMAAMVYAADIGARIANMSLGSELPRHGFVDDNGTPDDASDDVRYNGADIAQFVKAYQRASRYARQHGVLLVAAAGNDGFDGDHDRDLLWLPAGLPEVMSVSATAPVSWAQDPAGFLDYPAGYSNSGQSSIDVAAPGGWWAGSGDLCTVAGITNACWVFDLVFSTGYGAWYWSAGTSMAAPHASGVAALWLEKYPRLSPQQLEELLKSTAEDLGKPGQDDHYGAGRVLAPQD